ncbi:hypothetical protein [Acidocella sp.]|uniref:hypothetical protein n=1 Tax=Acidocella sp. TaxID=50710 RepID=UPI0017D159DA|nr:hypothetical protein [Acidocella sp.]NNM57344.1 hypothetical protein [Acidocella sp.]
MHADLAGRGYDGSYGRVAAFVRCWKADRQIEQQTNGRGNFVPLAFAYPYGVNRLVCWV